MVKFEINRKQFVAILSGMKATVQKRKANLLHLECTIVVEKDKIIISKFEYIHHVYCKTVGRCKIITPLFPLAKYINTFKTEILHFTVSENKLTIEDFSINAQTTFFDK